MPDQQPTSDAGLADQISAEDQTVEEQFDEFDGDGALDEPELLPRRPRRRLLAPLPVALLIALMTAAGFIGGVLVEKGESGQSTTTGAGASGLSSLRGGFGRGGGASGAGAGGAASAGGGGAGGGASGGGAVSAGGAGGRPTVGTVKFLEGTTLYVTNTQGNTVKVTPAPGASVTKTVSTAVKSIHPGETVTVSGTTGTNGAIAAESISVGAGGVAALFGRAGAGATGSGAGAAGSGSGAGVSSLFGSGG